jgi:hypothetical protein
MDGPSRTGPSLRRGAARRFSREWGRLGLVIVVRNREQILEIFASESCGVLDDARQRREPK